MTDSRKRAIAAQKERREKGRYERSVAMNNSGEGVWQSDNDTSQLKAFQRTSLKVQQEAATRQKQRQSLLSRNTSKVTARRGEERQKRLEMNSRQWNKILTMTEDLWHKTELYWLGSKLVMMWSCQSKWFPFIGKTPCKALFCSCCSDNESFLLFPPSFCLMIAYAFVQSAPQMCLQH